MSADIQPGTALLEAMEGIMLAAMSGDATKEQIANMAHAALAKAKATGATKPVTLSNEEMAKLAAEDDLHDAKLAAAMTQDERQQIKARGEPA